jgi:hypothetical protein
MCIKKEKTMNLNRNPTREELQTLLAACDDGEGIHVLWVERLGDVQITLLLTETDLEWIRGTDHENLQFHYESYGKNEGFTGKAASADNLYIATLFEKLLKDWEDQRDGLVEGGPQRNFPTRQIMDGSQPITHLPGASLVLQRMRALENKFWLEALVLADLYMEIQLKAISGTGDPQKVKNKRTGREVIHLAKQMFDNHMLDRKLYEKIKKFNTSRSRIFQNFAMEALPYKQLESIVMISESLITELKRLQDDSFSSLYRDGIK